MSFNHLRLEIAIRRRRVTKKALADQIGITTRALTNYQNGKREPDDSTLARLAAALDFPVSFFFLDDPIRVPQEGVSFRSLSRMTITQRDSVLAAATLAMGLSEIIESCFELPTPNIPDGREDGDPEAAADEVRTAWGLGQRPVPNLVHLLEANGVRVFSICDDLREVDAFSFWRGDVPFIFLNTRKSAERGRFDAAHELGHLVLHRHKASRGRDAEQEANAFASAFLMPSSSTIARAPRHISIRGIVEGKKVWGTSAMAYAFRLFKLKILSDWQYHNLVRKMSARGYRTVEPEPRRRETSQVLQKVFDALRSDGVTKAKIAERLGVRKDDLEQLVFGLVMTGIQGGGESSSRRSTHLRLVE